MDRTKAESYLDFRVDKQRDVAVIKVIRLFNRNTTCFRLITDAIASGVQYETLRLFKSDSRKYDGYLRRECPV